MHFSKILGPVPASTLSTQTILSSTALQPKDSRTPGEMADSHIGSGNIPDEPTATWRDRKEECAQKTKRWGHVKWT